MWKWPWSHVLTDVLMWDHAAKVKVVCRLWWCRLPVDDTVSFGSWAGRLYLSLCFVLQVSSGVWLGDDGLGTPRSSVPLYKRMLHLLPQGEE